MGKVQHSELAGKRSCKILEFVVRLQNYILPINETYLNSKCPNLKGGNNLTFKVTFQRQKSSESFYFLSNNRRTLFVILAFFKTLIFDTLCFLKRYPIFDGSCENSVKVQSKQLSLDKLLISYKLHNPMAIT